MSRYVMSTSEMDEAIDLLVDHGAFVADLAYFNHVNKVSQIRNPDGTAQPLTGAELTRVQVRAAIVSLIANGLIDPKSVVEMKRIFETGVSITND